ncbi:hypothetical protein [Cerasicoccus frondis]|uniref:hypothetical protein n=1 Tax=Cerasicoccus frondis TaxID=490090 RepID=UPI002852D237|nr:hypothetical protein [Cerasicoccus frondis]
MIRVRRSSINRFNTPDETALICFLTFTLGEGRAARSCAVIRPPADEPEYLQAAQQAARLATEVRAGSVFSFWLQLRDALYSWQKTNEKPAQAAAFGLALIERALMDGFCRSLSKPFANCLRDNDFKVELGKLCRPLKGRQPQELLEPVKTDSLKVQFAVSEGMPMAEVEAAVRNGVRQFSIGLSGQPSADLVRLISVAEVLDGINGRYSISLEGNGAFTQTSDLLALVSGMKPVNELRKLSRSIAYIEQPFPKEASLTNAAVALFAEWPDRPPIVIDESDDSPGACARALEWGYAGTVCRPARGVIPSLVDACLLGARRDREPIGKWTLAGGPLSFDLPLAQLAELSVTMALGLDSVSATAATLNAGAEYLPWREALAQEHSETFDSELRLKLSAGEISLADIAQAPFGCRADIDAGALSHV